MKYLDADAERALFEEAATASEGRLREIRDIVVEAHLPFVHARVWAQHRGNSDIEDVVAEGVIGLFKAFDRFDVTRGLRFKTYAGWWVSQMCSEYFFNRKQMIRIPTYAHKEMLRIRRGEEPDKRHAEGARLAEKVHVGSLEAITGDGGSWHPGYVNDDPGDLEAAEERDHACTLLGRLNNERERYIVEQCVMFGRTLQSLATEYGISVERVRQLRNRALGRMRDARIA